MSLNSLLRNSVFNLIGPVSAITTTRVRPVERKSEAVHPLIILSNPRRTR